MLFKQDQALDENTFLTQSANPNYSTFTSISWISNYLPTKSWKEYLPSLSTIGYVLGSAVLTLSFIPYAITPTPSTDLMNDIWWSSLSPSRQTFLIGVALVYFLEGSAARYKYLQMMTENLKKIFGQGCDSISGVMLDTLTIITAGIAAIPSAALGYFGTRWAGEIIAYTSSALNFFMTWAMRMVFLPNFATKLIGMFDENKQFQRKLISYLRSLKPEETLLLNNQLSTIDYKLINEKMIHGLFIQIFNKASIESVFVKNNTLYNIFSYFKTGLACSISIVIGTTFSLFLSQAGFEGAKLLCLALTENCTIEQWAYIAKLALIYIPGFTALVVGFMPTLELLDEILVDVFRHVKQKPLDVLKLLITVGVCTVTASSLQNAAIGIASKLNLFALNPNATTFLEKLYYIVYRYGNYGAGISLDLGVWLKILGLNKDISTTATIEHSIHWLRKNSLSEQSIRNLKTHGFFSLTARTEKGDQDFSLDRGHELTSVGIV